MHIQYELVRSVGFLIVIIKHAYQIKSYIFYEEVKFKSKPFWKLKITFFKLYILILSYLHLLIPIF